MIIPSTLARVSIRKGSWEFDTVVGVPSGLCEPADVVPALHQVADTITERLESVVSCGPRCGACCRQLVPVTDPEIGYLQRLVSSLPVDVRSLIRQRAEEATSELCGMNVEPQELCNRTTSDLRAFGVRWFGLGLPCPFLVDESCSIYEHRPLICREYAVTSPPVACATPGRGLIMRFVRPVSIWSRVARAGTGRLRWIPLSEALRADPPDASLTTGPDGLAALLSAGRVSASSSAATAVSLEKVPVGPSARS